MDETGEGEYYFSTGDGSEHNKDHRGAMQTGPIEINGKEYYYDSNSGVNRGRKVINSRIEIGPKDYRYTTEKRVDFRKLRIQIQTISSMIKAESDTQPTAR